MSTRSIVLTAALLWLALAPAAPAQTGEVRCVVCGEATTGGKAVILGDRAYAVHEFGCLPIWQRAEKQGLLRDLDHPLTPGDPLFQTPALFQADPASKLARGSARVWAAFLSGACLMSGSLAALFGLLTNRPRGRAFLLGFFLPAVGMVLVPVLPDLSKSNANANVNKGENA